MLVDVKRSGNNRAQKKTSRSSLLAFLRFGSVLRFAKHANANESQHIDVVAGDRDGTSPPLSVHTTTPTILASMNAAEASYARRRVSTAFGEHVRCGQEVASTSCKLALLSSMKCVGIKEAIARLKRATVDPHRGHGRLTGFLKVMGGWAARSTTSLEQRFSSRSCCRKLSTVQVNNISPALMKSS